MLEAAPPALQTLQEPVADRLREVREHVAAMVPPDFDALAEVTDYLLETRGKLLRPTLLLLANEVGGRRSDAAVPLAAVVELIHVATLVHDDAVDHSAKRRGMPTVNARWTHQVAIILGDYLYSRAVMESARVGDVEAIALLSRAANRMTVGEMRQLTSHDALDFGREDYFLLCECKTASLMATACELGALVGEPAHREPMRRFGFELGMAFQVTDDLLDYASSASVTGKPTGQDLREHKVTLPLIAALPRMDERERAEVRRLFDAVEPEEPLVERVRSIVERRGGLDHARREAEERVARAREELAGLPPGDAVEALDAAAEFVAQRRR